MHIGVCDFHARPAIASGFPKDNGIVEMNVRMWLTDRVAVVTGGAGGIGRAAARKFAREGAKMVEAGIDRPGGEETAKQIREAGDALFIETDVSSLYSVADKPVERDRRRCSTRCFPCQHNLFPEEIIRLPRKQSQDHGESNSASVVWHRSC